MSIPKDNVAGRRELERVMEGRRGTEAEASYKAVRRGWFFGEKALKKELLAQMSERLGPEHYGEERQESQEEKAQRVVAEELRRRRWKEASLGQRAKGDPEKVKIAMRLRKETLMTVAWIAERLQMGSGELFNPSKALSLNSPTFPFCPRVPVGAHSSFSNSGTEYLGFM